MENDWRTRWVKFKEKAIIGHWIDEDDGHQEEYNTYLSEFDTTKIENFISQELDKAREEGKREQAELDRALYSVSFEHIKNADFEKILLESVKKAREEGIRYALSEVQERVGMQNEEVYVLCNAILQESLILTTK